MSKEELKPCPCCSNKARISDFIDVVYCIECGLMTDESALGGMEQAIGEWNTRTESHELKDLRHQVKCWEKDYGDQDKQLKEALAKIAEIELEREQLIEWMGLHKSLAPTMTEVREMLIKLKGAKS